MRPLYRSTPEKEVVIIPDLPHTTYTHTRQQKKSVNISLDYRLARPRRPLSIHESSRSVKCEYYPAKGVYVQLLPVLAVLRSQSERINPSEYTVLENTFQGFLSIITKKSFGLSLRSSHASSRYLAVRYFIMQHPED